MLKNYTFSLFFKINLFFTMLLSLGFMAFNEEYTLISAVLIFFGLISTMVTLYLIFYLLLVVFTFSKRFVLYLSVFIFTVTNVLLLIDMLVFKLFHFHFNAMVLNIITSPDSSDSIQIGVVPITTFLSLVVLFVVMELYLIKKLFTLDKKRKEHLNKRFNRVIVAPLFLIILTEKVSYGMASLFSKNEIVSKFKVVPLYQPLTFTKAASKYFGFKAEEQAKYSIKTKADLKYPLSPLKIDAPKEKFNIIIVAFDALKYSILDEKVAPNITKFQKESLVFKKHYSGGNCTRFGIFSLMYGLNSTYWFSFLNSNQKPVLFDVLKKLDYDISVISSTNTNWPEFRKTCYVDIQPSIQDKFEGVPWKKDEQSTEAFLKVLEEHDVQKPLFAFTFLDAPHGYSFPPNQNIYGATGESINYMAISKDSDELVNTVKGYKNAVHYDDMLFGKMMAKLKAKKMYDNSLIIFTSDHGQEFFEQGSFGHNSSFSEGQTHVPFIVKLPKQLQGLGFEKYVDQSMSSHQDVVPTLLTLLGVKNSPKEYSNGANLFSDTFNREYIFSSNWNSSAIVTPDTTYVFSNLPNKIFNNEVRDSKSYERLKEKKSNSKLILDTINENRKFLK